MYAGFYGCEGRPAGRFDMAHKGSIFLDEIGDLDHSSQVKLLRVLQDRTYEVLGSSRAKMVDTRVICATNRNLQEMIAGGTFREDLLYRINLITIRLPALRERPKDIPLLVNYFVGNLREIYNVRPDHQPRGHGLAAAIAVTRQYPPVEEPGGTDDPGDEEGCPGYRRFPGSGGNGN